MRMFARLAVAAGATAVVLLAAPAANAEADFTELEHLSTSASQEDKANPNLKSPVGGLVGSLVGTLVGGVNGATTNG